MTGGALAFDLFGVLLVKRQQQPKGRARLGNRLTRDESGPQQWGPFLFPINNDYFIRPHNIRGVCSTNVVRHAKTETVLSRLTETLENAQWRRAVIGALHGTDSYWRRAR